VITAAVLGGVDINGGSGTMVGQSVAGVDCLVTFGMGLKNVQDQFRRLPSARC